MRQVTITKTYLKFNELNEKQQRKVLDNLRDINVGYEWYEFIREEFHNDLETLGFSNIKSQFSGFWSQGDGASFSAIFDLPKSETDLKERVEKLLKNAPYFFHTFADKLEDRKETSFKNDFLDLDFREELENGEEQIGIIQRGSYCHHGTMFCDHEGLQSFSRAMAVRYYFELEREYDYLTSDEAIKETIEANDYEFDSETLEIV